jgi:hypothetical protein
VVDIPRGAAMRWVEVALPAVETTIALASQSGFSFTSDLLDSDFAEIGHERNGVFFSLEETGLPGRLPERRSGARLAPAFA